jgi:putative transposase
MVKWRTKYGGMTTSMITKLKELEAENVHLKKKYADGRLKTMIVQEALTKKF